MFCPKILPRDSSGTPRIAELTPTNISGAAVASDISIKATVNFFKLKNSEISLRERMSQLPEKIKIRQDKMKIVEYKTMYEFYHVTTPFLPDSLHS